MNALAKYAIEVLFQCVEALANLLPAPPSPPSPIRLFYGARTLPRMVMTSEMFNDILYRLDCLEQALDLEQKANS